MVQERIGRVVDVAQTANWDTKVYRRQSGYAMVAHKAGRESILVWFGPGGSVTLAWRCPRERVHPEILTGPAALTGEHMILGGRPPVLDALRKGVRTHG